MSKLLITFLIVTCFYSCRPGNNNDATVPGNETATYVDAQSEAGQNIDRYLLGMEALGFSGAIIVSESDEVVLRKGYGFSDRENRRPYTPATIQTCGSVTKQFTAAAILLLESRGMLSVTDTITKYCNDVPEDRENITLHQLLTHSSGLAGGIGADDEAIEARDYFERAMSEALQFKPGTAYGYSNTGYSLLAMIIEKVTGQSYESFLRKELLLPAGLSETGYILPEWNRDQMAIGYRNGISWGEVYERGWIEDGPNWHLRGNGGMHTIVGDMYKWYKTVKGQGILDEEVAKRWITGYVKENNENSDYGYGWVTYQHDKWGKVITHSGSNRIFEASFVWLPEKDFFFYIQGNTSMFPAANQGANILSAAFDSSFLMPPLVETDYPADPETAQERAGMYYLDGGHLELTADDIRLVAKLTGQPVFDFMFDHNDEQKKRFADLNARTRVAMDKVHAGQEDALSGLMREDSDAIEATAPLLRRIKQIGNLDSLHVIGTFANAPGSRFGDSGPWTTFVYAEFQNWNQYWNLVWNEDETFREDRSGPWPTFVIIPAGEAKYKGIRQVHPWNMIDVRFEDGCLIIGKEKACPLE
ncbi:MAG: beta-lactamase family protein [Bacteroidales bacterium]|nr:beta-lactamase family protein [Bacteroidales bacterium]